MSQYEKAKNAVVVQVHKARCLSSLSLALESWKTPGELLVFRLHQNPEEVGCNTSHNSRLDEPAREGEDEQANTKTFFLLPPGVAQIWGGSSCFKGPD